MYLYTEDQIPFQTKVMGLEQQWFFPEKYSDMHSESRDTIQVFGTVI